jgi:hypothetical protein
MLDAFNYYVRPVYDRSPGTVEELQQKLRIRGMKLRRDLNVSLREDKEKWEVLTITEANFVTLSQYDDG